MSENKDETMTRFYIPTSTKLLYVFEIKVDNYDEIYGPAPDDDGPNGGFDPNGGEPTDGGDSFEEEPSAEAAPMVVPAPVVVEKPTPEETKEETPDPVAENEPTPEAPAENEPTPEAPAEDEQDLVAPVISVTEIIKEMPLEVPSAEELTNAIDKFGIDDVVVLCRSNLRANKYNMGIRQSVLFMEEQLTKGDKLMVVKNCYQFLENVEDLDFIANGDVAKLEKIWGYEERYGLHFASAILSFPDYDNIELDVKVILDTLESTSASLDSEQQKALFEGVYADYSHITTKKKRMEAVREDKYFNALQIKYATAITGHKSQGGQWKCVFVDNSLWKEDISLDDKKWLYTAITRGIERVYLVNFKEKYFKL